MSSSGRHQTAPPRRSEGFHTTPTKTIDTCEHYVPTETTGPGSGSDRKIFCHQRRRRLAADDPIPRRSRNVIDCRKAEIEADIHPPRANILDAPVPQPGDTVPSVVFTHAAPTAPPSTSTLTLSLTSVPQATPHSSSNIDPINTSFRSSTSSTLHSVTLSSTTGLASNVSGLPSHGSLSPPPSSSKPSSSTPSLSTPSPSTPSPPTPSLPPSPPSPSSSAFSGLSSSISTPTFTHISGSISKSTPSSTLAGTLAPVLVIVALLGAALVVLRRRRRRIDPEQRPDPYVSETGPQLHTHKDAGSAVQLLRPQRKGSGPSRTQTSDAARKRTAAGNSNLSGDVHRAADAPEQEQVNNANSYPSAAGQIRSRSHGPRDVTEGREASLDTTPPTPLPRYSLLRPLPSIPP
ncbi:hypothetical protein C8R45DRAFT_1218040 [Mycena sanguinolenta]|nr:hypothetical protein C8R45DRAFT_1218040 [Mycena sanguinolenta]